MVETALRDLILRPTNLEPGQYATKDDDTGERSFTVIRHSSGRTYEQIWCLAGESHKLLRQGDTIFERVFVREGQVTSYATSELVQAPPPAPQPPVPTPKKSTKSKRSVKSKSKRRKS